MDKKKMLKFIWGKGNQPTAERLKIQQQLFGFSKVSPMFESLLLLNHKLEMGDRSLHLDASPSGPKLHTLTTQKRLNVFKSCFWDVQI